MIFEPTTLKDAWLIKPEKLSDKRGFFARTWCQREMEEKGLVARLVQANISYNATRGTLRGMHYQIAPYEETKLVRCTRGAIYDVIIDLREDSPTFRQWFGVDLTAENSHMLYVPEGFAHGYQTLQDDTEVAYQVSEFFTPNSERGIHYQDPAFAVEWPLEVSVISEKDAGWVPYTLANRSAAGG
ncbi:dTDP-4-dehydrorhamnose 3,5-epimerase [Ectothiorhodospiraceae bacterium 2226]|nr:dTDP-4-dehydrorhamnose 3,5-epimerase [Ectothiorhodospiraceae bacterium 2226]